MTEEENFKVIVFAEVAIKLTYVGKATRSSLTTEPVWQIMRIDESVTATVITTWADGSDRFKFVWDDRATYTYS